jgi:hypothetical protein
MPRSVWLAAVAVVAAHTVAPRVASGELVLGGFDAVETLGARRADGVPID